MFLASWLCFFIVFVTVSYGQYEIPPVTLEAYRPRGFRASIRADPNTELFAFHGKVNEKINQIEPGEFNEDVKVPVDGYYTYFNPNLQLKPNDEVNYWVFVQHKKLGYRKDAQVWKVTELRDPIAACKTSVSTISDRTKVCKDMSIFEDQFDGQQLDSSKWIQEQYVPEAPDYEFVVYRNNENVTFLNGNHMVIRPAIAPEKDQEADPLDISEGCTKPDRTSDFCVHKKYLIQNPIISGRLVSKQTFSYVDVEVRAKLPSGDWMYPEIYLEDNNQNRLVIAYSRGNRVFTGNNNKNLGGTILFGGPILDHTEPGRSNKLSSKESSSGTFSDDFHTYRLKWTKDKIELFLDGVNYGLINSESIKTSGLVGNSPKQVRLVLGVGVGGISDFSDGFKSGTHDKPWRNRNSLQVKLFYQRRDQWLPTWGSGAQLQVDYVRVTAL